jgi:hypothetical protein
MNWRQFLDWGPKPTPQSRKIEVRQLGIQKVVFVRTKKNGGIRFTQIQVKEA